jgi:hypothetical protein
MFIMAKTGIIFIALCVGVFLMFTQGVRIVDPLLGLVTPARAVPMFWLVSAVLVVRALYKKGSSS